MSRLVTVSNRVALTKPGGSAGGLAVGLLQAMRDRGGLWLGWNGEVIAGEPPATAHAERDGITFATFPLTRALREKYYAGFANGTLWPLLHYFLAGFRYDAAEYAAYAEANELFASRLTPLLRVTDLIWVHDYHLVPLGRKLRARGCRQPLGFFLHVPFPGPEVLRALPPFVDFMRALVAYDLVGFQTECDRRSFLDCVRSIWGSDAADGGGTVMVEDRPCRTGVFPIGVDVDAISATACGALSVAPVQRMVQGLDDRRLIIGVDRLDYSKGLLERFDGYQQFLEHFPEHAGQVTYLQIAPLGRQDVRAYAQIRDSLERSSGRINGRFAEADWTPIRYLNRNLPHATLMGFLRAAHVCLVTPVRDGMNLVAKEFVAAQNPQDPGVLVLSDRAGAAVELVDALIVNPYDTRAIAQAIRSSLTMPLDERCLRHARLMAVLRDNDLARWHGRFTEELSACNGAATVRQAGLSAEASQSPAKSHNAVSDAFADRKPLRSSHLREVAND